MEKKHFAVYHGQADEDDKGRTFCHDFFIDSRVIGGGC
jgi:hypothetical protein